MADEGQQELAVGDDVGGVGQAVALDVGGVGVRGIGPPVVAVGGEIVASAGAAGGRGRRRGSWARRRAPSRGRDEAWALRGGEIESGSDGGEREEGEQGQRKARTVGRAAGNGQAARRSDW